MLSGSSRIQGKGKRSKKGEEEVTIYKADSYSCCAAPQYDYCVGGMDVTLATFFLTSTYTRPHLIDYGEAVRLAVATTAMMKKYADGVDGDTEVLYRNTSDECNDFIVPEKREIFQAERRFLPKDFEAKIRQHWGELNPHSWAQVDIERNLQRIGRKIRRTNRHRSRRW